MSLLLIAVTVIADFVKDKKYIELSNHVKEDKVPVIRGKIGASQSVSVWDIVVGDVILLGTGEMVPCDCLVIDSFELKVDVPDIKTRDYIDKGVAKSLEDPVLIAGCLITRGECRALVCCVGKDSTRGVTEPKLDTDSNTPL
jgi:magnesium-transporting ATPase (P-type)